MKYFVQSFIQSLVSFYPKGKIYSENITNNMRHILYFLVKHKSILNCRVICLEGKIIVFFLLLFKMGVLTILSSWFQVDLKSVPVLLVHIKRLSQYCIAKFFKGDDFFFRIICVN